MSRPNIVIGGQSYDDVKNLTSELRPYTDNITKTDVKKVPSVVGGDSWDGVVLDANHFDSGDVIDTVTDKGLPVAIYSTPAPTSSMRRYSFEAGVKALLTDISNKHAAQITASILAKSTGPLRATLIKPDKTDEWQTEYGEAPIVLPEPRIFVKADEAPDWATHNEVQIVVGDSDGNLILSGFTHASDITTHAGGTEVPKTLSLRVR